MSDSAIKSVTSEIDCPTFESPAFNALTKPLRECTVAIVTTASLHHRDQQNFVGGDTSFRVLDGSRNDWQLGHWSPNFDASGFAVDPNVVFPIDRLYELAQHGVIGRVASRHLSYAGNQFDLSTVRLDSGPEGAALLRNDGVDVVLLTPV